MELVSLMLLNFLLHLAIASFSQANITRSECSQDKAHCKGKIKEIKKIKELSQ